jgi:DNA-binding response OmpR family regulator
MRPDAVPASEARTAPGRVADGFSAGGTSYLAKPIDLEVLDEELRSVLAGEGSA